MPGFDGTGPMGMGPRTGGGFGLCPPGAGPAQWGYLPGIVYGVGRGGIPRGGGRGRAFGGGRGRWWMGGSPYGWNPYGAMAPYPAIQPQDEKQYLESQVAYLEEQLAALRQRIDELHAKTEEG
jgi:hypothetical protein